MKIQNKIKTEEKDVIEKLESCNSPYIVKHYFCGESFIKDVSNRGHSEEVDKMLDKVYDKQNGHAKIVAIGMDFLDGKDLGASEIKDRNLILKFTIQIASGLKWLHSEGIMHRDIKPENIMVNKSETAVNC